MALKRSRPHMPESKDEEGKLQRNMRAWRCGDCDFLAHGSAPPEACSECGAPGREFWRVD